MKRRELCIYALILMAVNLPLATGRVSESMIFLPEKVLDGELWRLVTHPFVHVTWYHLLLDGTAFMLLYSQLAEASRWKRTGYVAGCAAASLVAASLALPSLPAIGYCGLSGVGHGLMAAVALEMLYGPESDRASRRTGLVSLVLLAAKCLFEAATGTVVMEFLHFGLMGTPVALSHVGGVIGGAMLFGLFHDITGHEKTGGETILLLRLCLRQVSGDTTDRW